MAAPRLHWTRGRADRAAGQARALEWIGLDDADEPIARVVRLLGRLWSGWRQYRAVALDEEAKLVELRPSLPERGAWLACTGGQVGGSRRPAAAGRAHR